MEQDNRGEKMYKKLAKKTLIIWIITLFIGANVVPNAVANMSVFGNTLYVDDSGGADYTRIQDAIDNATNGDIIYVFNGTYSENIVIDKTINLIGQDRNTTIIEGTRDSDLIHIEANWVNISGFTIKNQVPLWSGHGIVISSDNNTIFENILDNNLFGISIHGSCNNITNNNFDSNDISIRLEGVSYTIIHENCFESSRISISINSYSYNTRISGNHISAKTVGYGIKINEFSYRNEIYDNYISKGSSGIHLEKSDENNIHDNHIEDCTVGIALVFSKHNNINNNNFISRLNARITNSLYNRFKQNYWDDHPYAFPPKMIIGKYHIFYPIELIPVLYPVFDWHPHPEPINN